MTDQVPVEDKKNLIMSEELFKKMIKETVIETVEKTKNQMLETIIEDHRRIVHWIRNISQIQFFRMDDVEKFEERVEHLENRIKALEKQLTPENESSKPS